MIADTIITDVRLALNDITEEYRFSESELLSAINLANRKILDDRPDLRLAADGTRNDITSIDHKGDTLNVDETYQEALMHYVLYLIYAKDNEDDMNLNLSNYHLQVYKALI